MKSFIVAMILCSTHSAMAASGTYDCKGPKNVYTGEIAYEYVLAVEGNQVKAYLIFDRYAKQAPHAITSGYSQNEMVGVGQVNGVSHVGTGLVSIKNAKHIVGNFFKKNWVKNRLANVTLDVANTVMNGGPKGEATFWLNPHDSTAGDVDVHHPQTTGVILYCAKGSHQN